MNEQIEGALLPCPFCGGTAHALCGDGVNQGGYFVECGMCRASTNIVFACGDDPLPQLMEKWNRRSAPVVAPIVSGRADQDEASDDLDVLRKAWDAISFSRFGNEDWVTRTKNDIAMRIAKELERANQK
jgi:Lar family restriction alleviation protein